MSKLYSDMLFDELVSEVEKLSQEKAKILDVLQMLDEKLRRFKRASINLRQKQFDLETDIKKVKYTQEKIKNEYDAARNALYNTRNGGL